MERIALACHAKDQRPMKHAQEQNQVESDQVILQKSLISNWTMSSSCWSAWKDQLEVPRCVVQVHATNGYYIDGAHPRGKVNQELSLV
jgi:hypothetical protein